MRSLSRRTGDYRKQETTYVETGDTRSSTSVLTERCFGSRSEIMATTALTGQNQRVPTLRK